MDQANQTTNERLKALEVKQEYTDKALKDINDKLDQLLTLKSKGVGAFWLVGLIFGSSLIGAVTFLVNLFQHKGP